LVGVVVTASQTPSPAEVLQMKPSWQSVLSVQLRRHSPARQT
jgi:hypothetical protein